MKQSISEAIVSRRTSKTSLSLPVSKELIYSLLEKASFAPYHRLEPWFVKIATSDKEKDFLYQKVIETLHRNGDIHDTESEKLLTAKMTRLIKDSPATILFGRKIIDDKRQLNHDAIEGTAALIQNFSLLAWEAELVGFWASSELVLDAPLAKELGFPEDYELIANYRLGYRDLNRSLPTAVRTPVKEWASGLLED